MSDTNTPGFRWLTNPLKLTDEGAQVFIEMMEDDDE